MSQKIKAKMILQVRREKRRCGSSKTTMSESIINVRERIRAKGNVKQASEQKKKGVFR